MTTSIRRRMVDASSYALQQPHRASRLVADLFEIVEIQSSIENVLDDPLSGCLQGTAAVYDPELLGDCEQFACHRVEVLVGAGKVQSYLSEDGCVVWRTGVGTGVGADLFAAPKR